METSLTISALLVRLNGKVQLNVEGILDAIKNGTIKNYPDLSEGRMTMMGKRLELSILYYTLGSMISHGESEDGWYSNEWKKAIGNGEQIEQRFDTVFYDEFVFLVSEGLIKVESYEFLSQEKIWANANRYFAAKEGKFDDVRIKRMKDAKTKDELKKEFRKLMMEEHPDNGGSSEMTVKIIDAYVILEKCFK